jgi:glycosyltransferase involved in cell wall biosynthesis
MALTSEIADAKELARLADVTSEPLAFAPAFLNDASRLSKTARVVFVNRYFYPDVSATSQILFDLACRLVQRGIEVHVVCSRQLYDDAGAQLEEAETVHGIRVHRVWTSRFGRTRLMGRAVDYASFYVSGATKLLELLRHGDIVVAKTDPPLISIAAAAIAKVRGARLVNWLQDVFPEVASHLDANPLPKWLNDALMRARDRSLAGADMNVVLGRKMCEHLQRRGIRSKQIRVIENWADGEAIAPILTSASQLRKKLGLQDKFVVGYSGNLGRAHEFETLLAAAERMKVDDRVVFLMVGGGAGMQQLKQHVEARRLENFRFLPYQPREALADSLAAADVHLVCLLPQLEGLIVPSKFYGILAAARPVVFIGHHDGELARIIRETGCGAAVRMGDVSELCAVLRRMRMSESLRVAMGERANALFTSRYTVTRATEQWIDVLRVCRQEPTFDFEVGKDVVARRA